MAMRYDPNGRLEEEILSLFAPLHPAEEAAQEQPIERWEPLARYLEPEPPAPREAEDCALDDIRTIARSYGVPQQARLRPARARAAGERVEPADVAEAIRRSMALAEAPRPARWRALLAVAALAVVAVAGAVSAFVVLPISW